MLAWTVLNIGQFSRNMFWGEDNAKSYRSAICTSTLISQNGEHMLVDPSFDAAAMPDVLNVRTGLKPSDIGKIFITHAHSDHFMGLKCFENAVYYAAPGDYADIRRQLDAETAVRLRPAPETLLPGVSLFPLPGHTMGLCGVLFQAAEGRVAVTGDAVMTRDFFRARQGYYNSADFAASDASIAKLSDTADIVVPGHDNYFIVKAFMPPASDIGNDACYNDRF